MLITSEAYVDIDMVPVTEVRLAAEIAKGIKFELTHLSPKPPSSQNLDRSPAGSSSTAEEPRGVVVQRAHRREVGVVFT